MEDRLRWDAALEAAGTVAPAAVWRQRLAATLREATGAPLVAVLTCPPGAVLDAACATAPAELAGLEAKIRQLFLPRIERSKLGAELPKLLGSVAHAPLSAAGGEQLAEELRRELLRPAGIADLVNLFLLGDGGEVLGWIAVGTVVPANQALGRCGAALTEVASLASRTLAGALALATGCGAIVPRVGGPSMAALTARERQVVRLVAAGLSDVNIAESLEISEQTVGSHLRRIFTKLKLHSRVELVALATS